MEANAASLMEAAAPAVATPISERVDGGDNHSDEEHEVEHADVLGKCLVS